jgi:uncharacterized membrane protein YeaQ/YmgE (transglycosylase-associated protein family)
VLGAALSVIASGFLIGALARLALPGPDPMPFWLTVVLGFSGSVVGGGIAAALFGARDTFDTSNHAFVTLLLEVVAAVVLLALYRRFVQRRPLSGPGAHAFPSRGFGIQRIRSKLHHLGVDPDALTRQEPRPGAELSPDEQAKALVALRERHEQGAISDEEYAEARERLRRY